MMNSGMRSALKNTLVTPKNEKGIKSSRERDAARLGLNMPGTSLTAVLISPHNVNSSLFHPFSLYRISAITSKYKYPPYSKTTPDRSKIAAGL